MVQAGKVNDEKCIRKCTNGEGRRFSAALLPRLLGNNIAGHTTREPKAGFELETKGFQYVIANLDKTSLSILGIVHGMINDPKIFIIGNVIDLYCCFDQYSFSLFVWYAAEL